MTTRSRYLSLPEAARDARCGRRVLLAAIHRHELPARLYLNRWWIKPEALATWRRAQRYHGPERAA